MSDKTPASPHPSSANSKSSTNTSAIPTTTPTKASAASTTTTAGGAAAATTTATTTTTTSASSTGISDRMSYKNYKDNGAPTSYDIWTSCIFQESDIIPFIPPTPDVDPTEVINAALSEHDLQPNPSEGPAEPTIEAVAAADSVTTTTATTSSDNETSKDSKTAQDAAAAAALSTLRKPLSDAQRKALAAALQSETRTELIQGEKVPIYLVIAPRGHLDLINNQGLARAHFKSLMISVRLCLADPDPAGAATAENGGLSTGTAPAWSDATTTTTTAAAAAATAANGQHGKKSKKKSGTGNDLSAVANMLGYTYSGPPASPLFMSSEVSTGASSSTAAGSSLSASLSFSIHGHQQQQQQQQQQQHSQQQVMETAGQTSVMDTMSSSTSSYIFTNDEGERVFQKMVGEGGMTIMDRGHGIVVIPLELPVCVKSRYLAGSSKLALCIQLTASPAFMCGTGAEMYELVDPRKQSFGSAAMESKRVLLPVSVLTPLRIERVRHLPSYTSRIVCFSATNAHKTLPITIARAALQVLSPGSGAPADVHSTVFGLADFPVVLGPRDVYQFAAKIDSVPALVPESGSDPAQSDDAQAWSLLEWSIPCIRGYLASRHDLSTVSLPKFKDFFISLSVPPFVRPQEVFEIEISVTNKTLSDKNISLNLFADTEQQQQQQQSQKSDTSSLSQTSVIAYPPLRCLRRVVDVGLIPILRAKTVCIPCVCASEGTYSLNPIIIVDKTDPTAPSTRYLVKETCSVFCSDLNHEDVERVPAEKDISLEVDDSEDEEDSDSTAGASKDAATVTVNVTTGNGGTKKAEEDEGNKAQATH